MRTFKNVSSRLIAAILAVAAAAPVAKAEGPDFAQVKVPFAFETTSGQHFQPGVYKLSLTGMHTILLRSDTGSSMIMISEEATDWHPVIQGKAVFTHYGDKYYLRSITSSGSDRRLLFGRSKAERESQVASKATPKEVELALLQKVR